MRRAVDYVAETVGVLLMVAVSVTFTAPLWIADAVKARVGRQRRAHLLDYAHQAPSGDRVPVGDPDHVSPLWREWS